MLGLRKGSFAREGCNEDLATESSADTVLAFTSSDSSGVCCLNSSIWLPKFAKDTPCTAALILTI